MKYIPQVKIFENKRDWQWRDVQPFGGTIHFGLESDVKAFLADWCARQNIKHNETRYITIQHEATK